MRNWKTGIGACLSLIGAAGFVLGPTLGRTLLGRPWSFLIGFTLGLTAGIGTALGISGLIDLRRHARTK